MREGGAAGVMEGGWVTIAWLMAVATLLGGVSGGDFAAAKFLQGEPGDLRSMTAGVVVVDAEAGVPGVVSVVLTKGVAAVIVSAAEGIKGLALTSREDPRANVGGWVIEAAGGDGLVVKAEVDRRSGMLLELLLTELACEIGLRVSVRLDFGAAAAREGVLVTGVVVCESGVEPGGV